MTASAMICVYMLSGEKDAVRSKHVGVVGFRSQLPSNPRNGFSLVTPPVTHPSNPLVMGDGVGFRGFAASMGSLVVRGVGH